MAQPATSRKVSHSARVTSFAHSHSKPLPPYLFLRSGTYYFKRKVPRGFEHVFPKASGGQVWKSLGTDLLEQARIPLAVEVSEFEFTLAAARRAQSRADASVQSQVTGGEEVCSAPRSALHSEPSLSTGKSAMSAPASVLTYAARGVPMQPGQTAHAPSSTVPKNPNTMRHLLAHWEVNQSRHRTVQTFHTAVDEFQTLHGPLPAQDITRAHVRRYRDTLIERHLSDNTIANRIGFLSTLFRKGQCEVIEDVFGNPFERIQINGGKHQRATKDRRAYSMDELNTIFSSKLYTEGYRPRGQAGEAAYWAPLLGPFLGARIEEVAQLRVHDVHLVNGTPCIRICNIDETQQLKNIGSYRRVPVHDVLIRCGFLEYVQSQKDAGQQRLFSSLSNANANRTWSNALGKWYARYLDEIGLADNALDYHSFRYSFKQQASLCDVPNETRDALAGHWVGTRDSGRVYLRAEERQYPFPMLVSAMKKLRYDELNLEHLFVKT